MSLYVETRIRGSLDEVWRLTQTPSLHARWDLRFTEIDYLPRPDPDRPQRFRYATRMGFGAAIHGEGETVGERESEGRERASALRFWSADPRSLIREGAGYWRYVPTADGTRFLTSYDYRVRFGATGRAFDRLVFRPLLGWATAWSFDRLRLWIELGVPPEVSLQRSLVHAVARVAVGLVWLYQGAVPKLLAHDADELAMLRQGGIAAADPGQVLHVLGWGEIGIGLALLLGFRSRAFLVATLVLMIGATVEVAVRSPRFLTAAFNPVSLNLLMSALAVIGLLADRDRPSAGRCRRTPPEAGR